MTNRLVTLESDYEYVLGNTIGNIMNLQADFSTEEWAQQDLQIISKELVNTAKWFALQQGLGGVTQIKEHSVNGTPVYINKKNGTGTLIRSIKAEPQGNTVVFWNDANLGRGYYAGHIEYGFHDRGGNPVAARPFMRPAFQAVARSSRNELAHTLQLFLQGGLVQNTTAKFATPTSGGYRRAFYGQSLRNPSSGLRTASGLKMQKVPGSMSRMSKEGTIRADGNRKGYIKTRSTLNDQKLSRFTVTYGSGKHLGNYADTSSIKVSSSNSVGTKNSNSGVKSSNKISYNAYGKRSDYAHLRAPIRHIARKYGLSNQDAMKVWDNMED